MASAEGKGKTSLKHDTEFQAFLATSAATDVTALLFSVLFLISKTPRSILYAELSSNGSPHPSYSDAFNFSYISMSSTNLIFICSDL